MTTGHAALEEARAAAVEWFWREVDFCVNDSSASHDEITAEVRRMLGAAVEYDNLFGASVLAIQGAAAYIAGVRHRGDPLTTDPAAELERLLTTTEEN